LFKKYQIAASSQIGSVALHVEKGGREGEKKVQSLKKKERKKRKKKSVANVKANVGGIIRSNDSSLYIFRNINYIFFLEREREREWAGEMLPRVSSTSRREKKTIGKLVRSLYI
jgi:hypothetical protein